MTMAMAEEVEVWLALAIGNSRCHWAQFAGNQLQHTWNTPHLSSEVVQRLANCDFSLWDAIASTSLHLAVPPPIWVASVVAAQSALWQSYASVHFITLEQVPLQSTYPTLGIDRAVAVWGAITTIGSPILVIDAGTALTFTGAAENQLVGGAILPGLQLQFTALGHSTAALPTIRSSDVLALLPYWATNTEDAIASGVVHTLLAGLQKFIEVWWQQFPNSPILLTGGDSERLHHYLQQRSPDLAKAITMQPHLIFAGIKAIKTDEVKPN